MDVFSKWRFIRRCDRRLFRTARKWIFPVVGGSNYAFGAAQTGEGTSEYGFLIPEPIDVPNIGQQIDLYLADRTPSETDLFYVYGGTNDFISPVLLGRSFTDTRINCRQYYHPHYRISRSGGATSTVPSTRGTRATGCLANLCRTKFAIIRRYSFIFRIARSYRCS